MRLALALAMLGGCSSSSPPPMSTCADSLAGTWHSDAGDWMLLDRGAAIEGYPLFDDSREPGGDPAIVVAPRAIDLRRMGDEVGGEISRRYMRGGDACIARVPVHVLACTGSTLEVILADTSPPTQFAPCIESARKNPSRREKWHRTHP
ncbi:MAG: hypothetical protein AB7L94_27650 [Kofleriaceae bacterium]